MIKNNFKIALRNFRKHKLFTLINIIGLSIGISAALVIYMIVSYDLSFDKFHKDGDRIYRVVTAGPGYNSGVMGPLPEAAANTVTGLESAAPFFTVYSPEVIIPGRTAAKFKHQKNIILADKRYFDLFEYKWLAGSQNTAFNNPNQVVLSSDQAHVYFPGVPYEQILGRSVIYGDSITTTITGIVESFKENTDLTFHDFISYSTGSSYTDIKQEMSLDQWGSISPASQFFIKLSDKTVAAKVEQQLDNLIKKNNPPKDGEKNDSPAINLQPLSDLHFNENYGNFSGRAASRSTLYGLMVIAAFLVILGCINFINLTTAQSAQRAKEIGIRKTIGSTRKQLILQFLSETFLITLASIILSFICAPFILKMFAGFIPAGLNAEFLYQPGVLIFLSVLVLVVSFLSGFYPALVLSANKPVMVLKGRQTGTTRSTVFRKSLTVTQFVIAQFFIMSTILVSKQIYYAMHKDLGFKKEAIIYISPAYNNMDDGLKKVFVDKLRALPQVEAVSVGRDSPSANNTHSTGTTYNDGKKEIKTTVQERFGDENYINVYHIKLLAGRNLRSGDGQDALLINQSFAKSLNFKNPADAIDKTLDYNGQQVQIVGVVADFYHQSLRSAIQPLVIVTSPNKYFNSTFHISLKPQTAGGNEWKNALASMERSWKEIYPDDDFDYHFFDESIAQFYESDRNTSILLSWATGLSILISCLGLLGLAIYTTSQRTKEIGVRKVLGASVAQLIMLLSSELVVLILIAFVIVTPAAWWAMNKWMESFIDRTSISWWIFAASGGGMLFITLLTTILQTSRAALTNPVNSLKSE